MNDDVKRSETYQRTVALVLALAILAVTFLIIRPFIVAIFTAAALAYIFYPLYKYFTGIMPGFLPKRTASSMLTCALIILIVLLPAVIVTSVMTHELRSGYAFFRGLLQNTDSVLLKIVPNLDKFFGGPEQLRSILIDVVGQMIDWLQGVVRGIPNLFINILVTIFSIYYFLKHGPDIYEFFKNLLPLPKERYSQILARFDNLSRGMVMGQIAVGLIQGILAWAGFLFIGVPNPVLWGFLTALISIIPMLGAVMVWVPIDLYLFAVAYTTTGEYWRPIALFLYGSLVVSTIDNILKPKIVGDNANIHPLVILFGILGGIQLFGIPGIVIGPLVLILFDLVIDIYRESL